jgi:drug/metabolite transporter (DMT)-like permease
VSPRQGRLATGALTVGALCCFAANSLLARAALGRGLADPATFTIVRLASGAAALPLIALAARRRPGGGSWGSALALFAYAIAFSYAYVRIPAAAGALLLFPAVQATIVGWSVAHGTRPSPRQWLGIVVALGGLVLLTLPGASAPEPLGAALMVLAGVAWGAYTLRGRSAGDPLASTAANFVRATALCAPVLLVALGDMRATGDGLALAVVSGALASGGGYILWYAAVPALGATRAAVVQLSVPPLIAVAAVGLLGEPLTGRLVVSAVAIVAGIALSLRPPGTGPPR